MISSDLSISLARTDRTVQHVSGRYCFWREKSQYKICSQQNGEERKYLDYLHHFLGLMIFRVIICAKLFCHCLVLSIRKKASSRGEAFITLANLPPAYAGGSEIHSHVLIAVLSFDDVGDHFPRAFFLAHFDGVWNHSPQDIGILWDATKGIISFCSLCGVLPT